MPSRPNLPCAGCGKLLWSSRTSLPAGQAMCRPCRAATGNPVRKSSADHGSVTMYDRQGCRCRPCKDAKAAQGREYRARRKAEGRPIGESYRRKVERACQRCSATFSARAENVKAGFGNFCSKRCNQLAMVDARHGNPVGTARPGGSRKPRKSAVRRRAEKRAAKAAGGSAGGKLVWIQGACILCGTAFLSKGAASRYCSTGCRAVSRRRKGWISYPDRLAIYRRDEYTCHICTEATSAEYDGNDPWSPTLDHIVPRAHGGSDDPSNLKVAHLWCNSVRSDLTYFTDGDLAGV